MQKRKSRLLPRCGPRSVRFDVELRFNQAGQMVVDLPPWPGQRWRKQPGSRVWFHRVEDGIAVTRVPSGERQGGRSSSRIRRTHLPLKLLLRYRKAPRRRWWQ